MRPVEHRLDVVAVGIQHEGRVVAGVVRAGGAKPEPDSFPHAISQEETRMHRLFPLILVTTFLSGCQLGCLGIELDGHPLKPEGVCLSRGGLCACDFTDRQGMPTPYPQLDCSRNPFTCPAVCAGADDFDDAGAAPSPGANDPRVPRLIVAGSGASSLAIWNNVDQLDRDAAPAEHLPMTNGVTALSHAPGVLAVGLQNMGVAVFDAPRSLNDGQAPRVTVSVGGGAAIRDVERWEEDLWVLTKSGRLHKLADFPRLTSASTPRQVVTPLILDAMTLAPFAGGASVLVSASSGRMLLSGTSSSTNFSDENQIALSPNAAHRLACAHATLFSADDASRKLELRRTIDFLSPRSGPDLTLDTQLGGILQLSVQHDVLVVVGTGSVALYTQASTLIARKTVPQKPDFLITDSSINGPIGAMLSVTGMLFVLDGNGVSVFRDVTKQATFVTKITSGINQPTALTLIE